MHKLLHITTLLGSIIILKAANINITNVNEAELDTVKDTYDANATARQIEALQKERDDLYIKINKAIDEAIPELEKINDTEALTGLDNLNTLRKQLKELHEASSDDDTIETVVNNTDAKFRRKLSITINKKVYNDSPNKHFPGSDLPNTNLPSDDLPNNHLPKDDLPNNDLPNTNLPNNNLANDNLPYKDSNILRQGNSWLQKSNNAEFEDKLIKSRDYKYTSLPRVVNRQKIAEQIQTWLLKQQEEKQRKRELKIKQTIGLERCPSYGKGKEKKSKKNQGTRRKANNFPCCRKCCKKSYLGCL